MSIRFPAEVVQLQIKQCVELFTTGVSTYDIADQVGINRRTVWNRLVAGGAVVRKDSIDDVCSKGHINPERYVGGNCVPCAREAGKTYYYENPPSREQKDLNNTRRVKENRSIKQQMVDAYGGLCKCCGEDEIEFLTIGHVNNDGKADREKAGGGGVVFYKYLKKMGWPQDGYQLECGNCNFAKGAYGYCPHEKGHRR